MAWSTYRKVLIALLCIALLVLILLLATYLLWGFTWSPWSHSEKCPNFCQCVLKNAKTLERTWSGNLADLDGVNGDDAEYPDASWANIPQELYSFLMIPQPPGFPETKKYVPTIRKNVPTIRKETTSPQTTTTTQRPYRFPPILSVNYAKLITISSPEGGEYHEFKHRYICTGAVLGRTYAVITKSCVYEYDKDNELWLIVGQINSNYTTKENTIIGENLLSDHNGPRVEYFKDLAKLRYTKPIGNDSFQYAQLLKRHVELKTAHAFVWTIGKPEIPVQKIEVDVKRTKLQLSTPLFMTEDDTYYLFGFAVNGRIIPNIYSTEYGKWLEKP